MALLTVITTALSILKATGLDEKLGKLIAGDKGGKAAEKVVEIAQRVTGATDTTTVVNDIQLDNAAALDVKRALIDQESEIINLIAEDRADAREMQEKAMRHNDPVVRRFVYYYAWFWGVVGSLFVFCVVFLEIPTENIGIANIALGFVLGSLISPITQFFYGAADVRDADK